MHEKKANTYKCICHVCECPLSFMECESLQTLLYTTQGKTSLIANGQ